MTEAETSSFYEIWFEHGVFITPGPRFARLDDAVEHARQMVQAKPQVSVSIRFPNVAVQTHVRTKDLLETSDTQVEKHTTDNPWFDDPLFDDAHEDFADEADEVFMDELHPAYDGDTSLYSSPEGRTSGFQKRTSVMSSEAIKQGLKKFG